MRFLHVADVHLDTSFSGRSESVRRRLRDASREAFRRAVETAIREDVHAFLVAGDLFDGERLSFQTERFLLEEVRRLAQHGVTVVYATGNHDPGALDAGPRPLAWPDGVHVVDDRVPQRIRIDDRDGRPVGWVTAVGHRTARERTDLSRLLPRPRGELAEVALLHTQVHASRGAEAHHAYAPSELSFLTRAGFDYWALGHVHVRQVLSPDPPVVYAGSLQGKSWADAGPRGATLVDLSDRDAPSLAFRPVASVRWETIRVTGLEDAASLDALVGRIERSWRSAREEEGEAQARVEWMIRVVLDGPTPLWRELRRREDRALLAREVAGALDALDVAVVADRVHPVVPLEEHRRRVDALGASLRLLERVRRGEAELDTLDPEDLAGVDGDDPEAVARWVRHLLEGADGELAARFLGREGP